MLRTCTGCKLEKEEEGNFIARADRPGKYYSICRPCRVAKTIVHHRSHKDQIRDYNFRFKYGISLETYNEMFAKQNGCCAICSTHQSILSKSLAVDHNHITGKVRALLCDACNRALGFSKENIEILKKMIDYLS